MRTVNPDSDTIGARRWIPARALRLPAHDTVRAAVAYVTTALVFILLSLTACNSDDMAVEDPLVYRSMWIELYPDSLRRELAQNTLQGAFYFAAAAESQAVAEERWAKFHSAWAPAHGEFEDAMHAHLVNWAELEMQRLYYQKQKKQSAMQAVSDKLRELAAEFE